MKRFKREAGAAFLSTLIALPVLGAFVGGSIELGLLYQKRAVLNSAVISAARSGAHEGASPQAIRQGLARGMAPLHVKGSGYGEMQTRVLANSYADVMANACVRILNPNKGAFTDFDVTPADPKRDNTISLYELETLNLGVGAASGTSIQDAMLLQVYVLYGAKTNVPVIGSVMTRLMASLAPTGGMKKKFLQRGRFPIEVQGITRMQSNAVLSDMVEKKAAGKFSC